MSFTSHVRRTMAVWAAICLLVTAFFCFMVSLHLSTLNTYDLDVGTSVFDWSAAQVWMIQVLVWIEAAFGTIAMTTYTVLTAAVLLWRRHRRAAGWTVLVMVGASVTTTLLKNYFGRRRPTWDNPVEVLDSFSFPSGHSSGIASAAGVAIVLLWMFVRRRNQRRIGLAVALAVVALVGADRLLLGVHNVSDVVTGYAVGAFWVLGAALVFDPAPRSQARDTATSSAATTEKKLAVVLNPIKIEDAVAFRALVGRMAADAGWSPPTWHETTAEDPGRAMAERAAIDGAELVLVCGGDGTVRTVCAELAGTGIPVGIVPAGTGNLLARNLGVPLFLQAAVDVALHGQDRAIDLVRISGDQIAPDEHFMVMAGMGFDAAIMEGANDQIKAKVGWLAYVVSGLKNLMFPAVRVEVSIDEGPWTRHRARTVVIGNVGYLQAGMPLLPDAAIDDGILDVVILDPRRFLSWVPLAVRVLSKGKRTDDTINRMTGRTVAVRASADTPRQLDGDSIGAGRELRAEVLHGRLLVRVPH